MLIRPAGALAGFSRRSVGKKHVGKWHNNVSQFFVRCFSVMEYCEKWDIDIVII